MGPGIRLWVAEVFTRVTRMHGLRLICLVPLLIATAAFACPAASVRRGPVDVALAASKAGYVVGEAVELTLTVTNWGVGTVTYRFNDAQRYDFVVMRENGAVAWQWSHDKAFAQVLGTLTLPPGDSRVYREGWDQKNIDGEAVVPGRYVVEGIYPPRRPPGIPGVAQQRGPRVMINVSPLLR